MRRRDFAKALGATALVSTGAGWRHMQADERRSEATAERSEGPRLKTWLFWDWWHIEHQDNVELCQGRAEWRPEGTYEDPTFDYLGCWPTVWRDEQSGGWRMLYCNTGFPLTLMGAESDDCEAFREEDSLERPIRWRDKNNEDLVGKVVRLEMTFRNARIYALRGSFHWLDALDVAMCRDGKPIDTTLFDD
ncbi:MAG: hypothetical protein HQ582_20405 [Planctomycetes bacterium]|nr:hypothetical protein [Planctomycetota bacterium]